MRFCENIDSLAVLMGGESSEAEISREGALMVAATLSEMGVEHQLIDVSNRRGLIGLVASGLIKNAFNLVHGEFGEDGDLAALLECYGVPHTGAPAATAMLCYDKDLCKNIWRSKGLPTPGWERLPVEIDTAPKTAYPAVLKPARSGSSLGITIVNDERELVWALEEEGPAADMIVEELAPGREYSASIVQGELLPVIEIVVEGAFYDYHAKYESEATKYLPAPHIDGNSAIRGILEQAWRAVGCRAWGRIDFIVGNDGPQLLEINSVPGMGSHSLLPKSAKLANLSYTQLVGAILANCQEVRE